MNIVIKPSSRIAQAHELHREMTSYLSPPQTFIQVVSVILGRLSTSSKRSMIVFTSLFIIFNILFIWLQPGYVMQKNEDSTTSLQFSRVIRLAFITSVICHIILLFAGHYVGVIGRVVFQDCNYCS